MPISDLESLQTIHDTWAVSCSGKSKKKVWGREERPPRRGVMSNLTFLDREDFGGFP